MTVPYVYVTNIQEMGELWKDAGLGPNQNNDITLCLCCYRSGGGQAMGRILELNQTRIMALHYIYVATYREVGELWKD